MNRLPARNTSSLLPNATSVLSDRKRRRLRDGSLREIGGGLVFCRDVLRNGMQRQRAAAVLGLAMRQPGQPLFEVRAPRLSLVEGFPDFAAARAYYAAFYAASALLLAEVKTFRSHRGGSGA